MVQKLFGKNKYSGQKMYSLLFKFRRKPMEVFADFLAKIDHPEHKERIEEVLNWVHKQYPDLVPIVKWNQPIFTNHDTFIIGFSVAKNHLSVAPEKVVIERFFDEIAQSGYEHTKELIRIKWNESIDFSLLEKMIEFNIEDKADCSTFWRK